MKKNEIKLSVRTAVEKTFTEQQKALYEMFDMFPEVTSWELDTSSYNDCSYNNWVCNIDIKRIADKADDFHIFACDLFEYGSPKLINKSHRIYTDFIRITFSKNFSYNYYFPDGHSIDRAIKFCSSAWLIGLKDFRKQFNESCDFMNNNPDKELVKRYRERISEINDTVNKWEEAIKSITVPEI